MPRAKGGPKTRRRHKKTMKLAKGYVGGRRKTYRQARETVERGLTYAYRDRKQRKRDFRSLWIVRINAAARANGMSYSRLVTGLRTAGVEVDRKMLAALAVDDPQAFAEIAALARAHVGAPPAP
jgi:large subunit ribosomal protein L20